MSSAATGMLWSKVGVSLGRSSSYVRHTHSLGVVGRGVRSGFSWWSFENLRGERSNELEILLNGSRQRRICMSDITLGDTIFQALGCRHSSKRVHRNADPFDPHSLVVSPVLFKKSQKVQCSDQTVSTRPDQTDISSSPAFDQAGPTV